jgi:hypothetical protein
MNITSNIDRTNLTSLIIEEINENELIQSTITTTTTKQPTTTTINTFLRLFNSTRIFPFLRLPLPTTSTSSVLNKYFIFNSISHHNLRCVELGISSLTLALYAIVFVLFLQITVLRISRNTDISGGDSRSRHQRRRQRMRSLIWTLNYLLVDVLTLIYEIIYLIIHLVGVLPLKSFAGRFYCQLQVYLPLYLTVLMAYSLTAISFYRRRHFVNLNNQILQSNLQLFLMISALWIMPLITSTIPTFVLVHLKILKITQHETTNQCQISYKYESDLEAMYIFYRLGKCFLNKNFRIRFIIFLFIGNIFLLPISISLVCYILIYVDLLRMQRRFSRAFKRHVLTRKNLIIQILFLFLNFAVLWLPAEIIMLYTKNPHLKDALQVTKSLNILLDPLIIAIFDTRFKSAAKQIISICPFIEYMCSFVTNRPLDSSISTQPTIFRRLERSNQMTRNTIWNNDDITVLELVPNHSPQRSRTQQQRSSLNRRQLINKRRKSTQRRTKIVENHV